WPYVQLPLLLYVRLLPSLYVPLLLWLCVPLLPVPCALPLLWLHAQLPGALQIPVCASLLRVRCQDRLLALALRAVFRPWVQAREQGLALVRVPAQVGARVVVHPLPAVLQAAHLQQARSRPDLLQPAHPGRARLPSAGRRRLQAHPRQACPPAPKVQPAPDSGYAAMKSSSRRSLTPEQGICAMQTPTRRRGVARAVLVLVQEFREGRINASCTGAAVRCSNRRLPLLTFRGGARRLINKKAKPCNAITAQLIHDFDDVLVGDTSVRRDHDWRFGGNPCLDFGNQVFFGDSFELGAGFAQAHGQLTLFVELDLEWLCWHL